MSTCVTSIRLLVYYNFPLNFKLDNFKFYEDIIFMQNSSSNILYEVFPKNKSYVNIIW